MDHPEAAGGGCIGTLGCGAGEPDDAGNGVLADAEGGRRTVVRRRDGLAGQAALVDDVSPVANAHARGHAGALEGVVGLLQVQPERMPWALRMRRQVGFGHAEGEHVHVDAVLALAQGPLAQRIDLVHDGIGHRKAADRRAAPVHQDVGAGAGEGPIEGVGKTRIEGKILMRPWVHLIWGNVIKSLRRLVIALGKLRPELS